jgi:hypothetical protein
MGPFGEIGVLAAAKAAGLLVAAVTSSSATVRVSKLN